MVIRVFVVHTAVVVVYFVGKPRVIYFDQGVYGILVLMFADGENVSLVYFPDVPMSGNGITGRLDVVESSGRDVIVFN